MEETFSDAEEPIETVPVSMADDGNAFDGASTAFSHAEADDYAMEDEDEMPKFDLRPSHEAKIRELLRNISSIEVKLCADGSKEFMKLLRGSYGSELLYEYVRSSSKFTELMEAWNRWRGKPGLSYILSLLSVILGHPEGKYRPNDPNRVAISRVLDKFSRSIVEEKLDDIYKELNSKEGKRQKAALLLMGSIVRRGSLLAAEVAKSFDFKLPILPKLSEYRRKPAERRKKHSTRGAFVEFAMSFLEAGKPGLLRWVIQQREVFSGILRGLGNDDDETVVYVLSTLRDQILTPESLIPPSLRSVLFGSVTLEQLVDISARDDGGLAAKVAHEVLVMVCTDPSNGLMPDLKRQPSPLKGNPKRLLGLMKKLRATEIGYHRDLLLAIVNGRSSIGSAYLDEFPYNLEDNASPTWLSAATLAANVIGSVSVGISWDFLVCDSDRQLTFESSEVQSVFKCVCPRPVSRIVLNKGLLHPNPLMKHGILRLLLEVLKFLSSFIDALSVNSLYSLKRKIQDEVRILLPDPQVLFKLLSSFIRTYERSMSSLKRAADPEDIGQSRSAPVKKLKVDFTDEDIDILVGGLNSGTERIVLGEAVKPQEAVTSSQLDDERLMDIWGSNDSFSSDVVKNAEVYFHCNVLEALKIFHGALYAVSEVSYDVFRLLPSNPLEFPSVLLHALLSMLIEHLGFSQDFSPTLLRPVYKHLQYFLNLSIQSSIRSIKDQAYVLAKLAMRSTGAFDKNPWEIGAWLLFLPACAADDNCCKDEEGEFLQSLSTPLVSFLCDAVSTVGNKLVNSWALLKYRLSNLEVVKDQKVDVSPLIICVMDKCLKLLSAESEKSTLPVKTMISLYVCNTLRYLLQTQVEAETLAAIIHQFLSERIVDRVCEVAGGPSTSCEWRPLVHLFWFSQSVLQGETCLFDRVALDTNTSFLNTIAEVKSLLKADSTQVFAISKALYSTLICTAADDVLENLPLVMEISGRLPGFHHYFVNYFYHDQSIMSHVSELWPQIFSSGLGMSVIASDQLRQDIDNQTSLKRQCSDFESSQRGDFVFGSCLREAPFHMLFPAVIFCGCEYYSKIKNLLMAKLSNLTAEQIVSSLRLVLFWFHQMMSTYRKKPSEQLEFFFEICSVLVDCILAQLSTLKLDSRSSATAGIPLSLCIQQVSETVFGHPAVFAALSCESGRGCKPNEILLTDNSNELLKYCGERVCKPEIHVLNLLSTTSDHLVALCAGKNSLSLYPKCRENILKALSHLIQRLVLIFKESFSLWCSSQDVTFFPVLYAILALNRHISPIEILELANWMLAGKKSTLLQTSSSYSVCLGMSMACAAFDMVAEYLQPLNTQATQSDVFCAAKKRSLDAALFESIYMKAFQFATNLKLHLADVCLLKSLNAAHSLTYRRELLPLSVEMMRVIASTPIKLLSHCIYRTNTTKAKLLFLLTEISPLHLSVFGCLFLNILRKGFLQKVDSGAGTNDRFLSDQDYLMLMPAAFSYISSMRTILGEQSFSNLEYMLSFYSTILLDGFCNWKDFVSSTAFQVESGSIMLSSVENLLDLFESSLLGKAVNLLRWHLAITGCNMSMCLKVFCSICPSSGALNEFLDTDVSDVDSYSVGQLLNFVIRVIAKISLSLVLLFPENNKKGSSNNAQDKGVESAVGLNDEDSLRFLEMLVSVWKWVVQKLPLPFDNSAQQGTKFLLFRSLELYTLKCISRLTMDMRNHFIQIDSLPFVKKIAEVSLRHRFGDSATLETLRRILSSLSDGKLPVVWFFQRLLAHSQLAPTIGTVIESSNCTPAGMVAKPISSFLRSLIVHSGDRKSERYEKCKEQLEVVKLLRLLFDLRAQQGSICEDELGVNWRGLVSLLLPSYGATMSEIDLELYSILSRIESARGMDHSIIADLDYLWGSASLRMIKEHFSEHVLLDKNTADAEEDCRRSQFRDNLPIDLRLLIRTILYFPYARNVSGKPLIFNSSPEDNIRHTVEECSAEFGRVGCYDPVFLLSFSIYSLSMGYLDPVEFAGLGLLAMALVSMASPEDGVRKLGYEVLGKLKDALDGSQKKREATRLKNLLAYFQNAIEDPWQKIPSVIAVFIAEASVILLDPSHDHYAAISKIVEKASQTKLSKINLESIPLFHDMFWSSSMNFGADRMWVLRLLYAGINAEDDGRIFIRNSVPEILLSVYTSPLSNNEEKGLILQVLKKCIKVQNVACYLIEKCCFLSWLSKAVSLSLSFADGRDIFSSNQLVVLLEVVHEIVSSKSIMEWLENYALEQLSDLSCNLFDLLIRCSKLVHETLPLVVLVLKIIISALEISQRRKMYQPHFTPSMWSLYQLYQAVHRCDNMKSSLCAELGLKAILMSVPPITILQMGQQEISQFLMWAVATAIQSDSKRKLQRADLTSRFKIFPEEHRREDSLMPSLLSWLVASVILWRVSCSRDPDAGFRPRETNTETLLSLLKESDNRGRGTELACGSKEVLAVTIYHLQQLLGGKCPVLPSVVAALSILLLSDGSYSAGSATTVNCENPLPSLWSNIRYPPEADPAWRWSLCEPSTDVFPERNDLEKMDERHACQKLLVIISGKLRKKSADYQLLSLEELESSGLFEWERTNLVQE